MHILPSSILTIRENANITKLKPLTQSNPADVGLANKISYLNLPKLAFSSHLIKPNIKSATVQNVYFAGDSKERAVKFLVYPQDPTFSEPEICILKGDFKDGPVSDKVVTVNTNDDLSDCSLPELFDPKQKAVPDADGNFICDVNSTQFDRVNSFYYITKTIQMYEKALDRDVKFAFNLDHIRVNTRGHQNDNATYLRIVKGIVLPYFENPYKKGEICYTSRMADIICHESGHMTLDGLKPSYLDYGKLVENRALHESFADITAILNASNSDTVIDRTIKLTGGDLRKENPIASFAEQFGFAQNGRDNFFRNAINDIKMSDFSSGKIEYTPYNVANIFTGAFYDMFVAMTNEFQQTMPLKEAIKQANEILTKVHARAFADYSPPGNITLEAMAKAFLQAEKAVYHGKYNDLLETVFINRELLNEEKIASFNNAQKTLPSLTLPDKIKRYLRPSYVTDFINENKAKLTLPQKNNYLVEKVYKTKNGETFIHILSIKPGAKNNGYEPPPIDNGYTLAFDNNDKLIYKTQNVILK